MTTWMFTCQSGRQFTWIDPSMVNAMRGINGDAIVSARVIPEPTRPLGTDRRKVRVWMRAIILTHGLDMDAYYMRCMRSSIQSRLAGTSKLHATINSR